MKMEQTLYSNFYTNYPQDVKSWGLDEEAQRSVNEICAFMLQVSSQDEIRSRIITLLSWYKAVESALMSGERLVPPTDGETLVSPSSPSVVPEIFQGLLAPLFMADGTHLCSNLRAGVKTKSVYFWVFRQISLAFSKAIDIEPDVAYTELQNSFVSRMTNRHYGPQGLDAPMYSTSIMPIARLLLRKVLSDYDGRVHPSLLQWESAPFGRHGPGAVTDGSSGQRKWKLRETPRVYPETYRGAHGLIEGVLPSDPDYLDSTSRLTCVPKDLTKKRLICVEPKEMMFCQQGLRSCLEEIITHSPFSGRAIRLDDQSQNFWLSRSLDYCTIDMSDASDLLSKRLCKALLPREVYNLLTRFRSSSVELLNGCILPSYEAMATMGNALCFPVESLVFWALSLAAMLAEEVRLSTYRSTAEVVWVIENNPEPLLRRHKISVFGDDIIVPRRYFSAVVSCLTNSGLRVNRQKSAEPNSPLRESCGAYWWCGDDVRVVRFRHALSLNTRSYVALVEQIGELHNMAMSHVVNAMFELLSSMHPLPTSSLVSIQKGIRGGWVRWNSDYQRLEARLLGRQKTSDRLRSLRGETGLYAYFTDSATLLLSPENAQCVEWDWVPLSALTLI